MNGKYELFTTKEIKPTGWLKKQLEIQAEGLSGNLDKIWPDIRDSAWIGGSREGWERVPYWLDGFIPLAYLLENEDMIARVRKYINAIIENQKPDGWICPCEESERPKYDTWAVQLISKALTVYYECSGDERVPEVLYKAMKNYYDLLKAGTIKLFGWGEARWFEGFIALNLLYKMYQEEWIRELGKILREQGLKWFELRDRWVRPLNEWTFQTHIVNLGMMMKYEAVCCELLDEDYTDKAGKMYDVLYRNNGTPVEIFTGDECLSGLSPIQGTELCSVAELMYSYELLYAFTGDKRWAERLEVVAFNAFPATNSDDMWTHQYDQMSNQIACVRFPGRAVFRTNGGESHLFGLEPNYGCCTANFNQAWPKFAESVYMRDKKGIIAAFTLPATVRTVVKNVPVEISCDTEYPFKNTVKYTVKTDAPVKFSFRVRIPSFAKNLTVDGKPTANRGIVTFDRTFDGKTEIVLSFDADVEIMRRPNDLASVKCGSLVFSIPVKAEWNKLEYTRNDVERKFPYCDYELKPVSDWSMGYASKEFTVERRELSDVPFSSEKPAVVVRAKVAPINWGLEDGFTTVCAKVPESRKAQGEAKEIELYPYGCAKLRVTEVPFTTK